VPPTSGENLSPKGPGVFTGYFKSPQENSSIFTTDGFFRTGDKARKDEVGNITITGRIKDIINRSCEKISAIEIENLMSGHPDIRYEFLRLCMRQYGWAQASEEKTQPIPTERWDTQIKAR
jgi:non-ribosomal peptide synthetase component E (peptide arylation enzyme)